jgi:TolA-binding protein
LKKGKHDKAVKYFQQVIHQYPKQVSATMKAQNQLNTIAPQMSNIARTPLL